MPIGTRCSLPGSPDCSAATRPPPTREDVHNLTEEVRLVLPARPELVGVARLTAASLAGTIDFSLNEIEDLKIAVEELCHQLIASGGNTGSLTLTYRVGADTLEVIGTGPSTGPKAPDLPSPHPLSNRILEAVTDDYALDLGHDLAHFRLVKRRAARV